MIEKDITYLSMSKHFKKSLCNSVSFVTQRYTEKTQKTTEIKK